MLAMQESPWSLLPLLPYIEGLPAPCSILVWGTGRCCACRARQARTLCGGRRDGGYGVEAQQGRDSSAFCMMMQAFLAARYARRRLQEARGRPIAAESDRRSCMGRVWGVSRPMLLFRNLPS